MNVLLKWYQKKKYFHLYESLNEESCHLWFCNRKNSASGRRVQQL